MQSMTNTATGGETQGGGFMKDAEKVGEDGMIDQQVNNVCCLGLSFSWTSN